MTLAVERVDVWAASIQDQPGGLTAKLAALANAKADLEFVIARRSPEKPGHGVVFLTPLRGAAQEKAAKEAGFAIAESLHSVRVQGNNMPGIGAQLTEKLAAAGINLRGLSAAVIGNRFTMHLAFDTAQDAEKAMKTLQQL